MPSRSPLAVVLAGPNGAGKSTAARGLLVGALAVDEFVNADTIAAGLSAYRPESVAVAAGRILLARLDRLAGERRDFAFETTLAGLGHARRLRELCAVGYRVHIVFLALPSPDVAIARVAARVRAGGHHVPDDVVRRRFAAGRRNFDAVYRAIADTWQLYDNSGAQPVCIAAQAAADAAPIVLHPSARDIVGHGTVHEHPIDDRPPCDRVNDVEAALRALREAFRETVLDYRRRGEFVVMWRDGKVVWVPAHEIRLDTDPEPSDGS
jgi:predicted ABC-type ATPase